MAVRPMLRTSGHHRAGDPDKATGSVARVNFEIIDKIEALDSHTMQASR